MRRLRAGQLLIVTLWMLGLVTMAAGAVVLGSAHEARLGRIPLESLQREAIVEAAVQQAIALLTNDDPVVDHLGEFWARGEAAGQHALANIPGGAATFTVADEEHRINLNIAAPGVLERLVAAVNVGGVNAAEVADAIVDWRTASEPETGMCADRQPPCHNGLLSSVDELRLVPGMTPELFEALVPYVTVSPLAGASVNINTAPAIVLDAMGCPGAQLVARRESADPPILPSSDCPGTGQASTAFTVSVEAWVATSSLHTRLQAVIDRDGHILAWLPQ